MGELLIRGVDEATLARLDERAASSGIPMDRLAADLLSEALAAKSQRMEGLAQLRRFRADSRAVDFDTTAALREDRDRR